MEEIATQLEFRSDITYSDGTGIIILRAKWGDCGRWEVVCPHAGLRVLLVSTREEVVAIGKTLEPFVLAGWETKGRYHRAQQALEAAVTLENERLIAAYPSAEPPEQGSTMGDHASSQL